MQAVSCNLKLTLLFVSFLSCVAALSIISVLLKPQIYFTAFGVNCRKVNLVISVMVLACFTTVGLRQSCITLVKAFSHSSIHVERAFQGTEASSSLVCSWLKRLCIYDYTITMCTCRRTGIYLHTGSTKLKSLTVPSFLHTVYFMLKFLPKLEVAALHAL